MSRLPRGPFDIRFARKRQQQQQLVSISTASLPTPTPTSMDDDPQVGDRVLVEGKLHLVGTLRYLGPTDFKPGNWAGIELDERGHGKNNGTVQGITYFTCPDDTGIFVLASKLVLVSKAPVDIKKNSFYMLSSKSSAFLKRRSQPKAPRQAPQAAQQQQQQQYHHVPPHPSHLQQQPLSPAASDHVMSPRESQSSHVRDLLAENQRLQQHCDQQQQRIDALEKRMDDYERQDGENKKSLRQHQAQLGWEQHRVHEARKEKEAFIAQITELHQRVDQHTKGREIEKRHHRKEVAQLLDQQTQLIQELQTERTALDQQRETLHALQAACRTLLDPFDVRPGLSLASQIDELRPQIQALITQARDNVKEKKAKDRTIHDLRRDITHLESLIDTNVGKEAELLDALNRQRALNKQLMRDLRKTRKYMADTHPPAPLHPVSSSQQHLLPTTTDDEEDDDDDDDDEVVVGGDDHASLISSTASRCLSPYCEICEMAGHDLLSCKQIDMPPESLTASNSSTAVPSPVPSMVSTFDFLILFLAWHLIPPGLFFASSSHARILFSCCS
ncbi:hypothetical protein BC940DRAFT_368511 [Gongronella butleri]|nr:hypothetical protein BC940DRAFT_368511 [Gongronella butleri]